MLSLIGLESIKSNFFLVIILLNVQSLFGQQPLRLVVDQYGKGDYTTIQEAVYAVRDHFEQPVEIFIKKGTYHEKVVIPAWKRHIHLIGENRDSTIIVFDDYSGKERPDRFRLLEKITTYNSYTLLIQANDVVIKNLTISNSAGPVGQAVALHLEGDRIAIIDCNILGWQDTFYLSKAGTKNFIKNCYIDGSTDFIFGAATAIFENCTIHSKRNSYVTAASTAKEDEFGFIFLNSRLTTASDVTKVYLGRPWRPYAKTYFVNCELGNHIVKQGWHPWDGDKMFPDKTKTTDYREYGSFGQGAPDGNRATWAKVYALSKAKNKFTFRKVFKDWTPE